MGILDITEQAKTRKGPPCTVCEVLDTVAPEEAAALRSLLADKTWRYSEISKKLDEKANIDLPPFSLRRHATGGCWAREKLR